MAGRGRRIGAAVLAYLAFAPPLAAQDAPLAVGLISYGAAPAAGGAICTGVLVAPDLVLTAAHCVRASAARPETVRFAPGWFDGQTPAPRRVARILLQATPTGTLAALAADMALLVLDTPIPTDTVPSLPLGAATEARYTLIGYRRDAPDRIQRRDDCTRIVQRAGLLGLGCRVVSGNSGAPVLAWDGAGWRVVAIAVATNRDGPVQAWAALPPPEFVRQILTARQ